MQPLLNDDPIVAQLDVSENRTIRFDNIGVSVIEAPENETDIDFNLNIDDATNQQPLQPESLDENGLPLERNTPSRTPSGLQTAINKLGKKAQSRRKTHTVSIFFSSLLVFLSVFMHFMFFFNFNYLIHIFKYIVKILSF